MTNISNEVIDRMRVSVLNFRVTREELSHVNIPAGVRGHLRLYHEVQTYLMGKFTIVGFFSTKKLFLLNLCTMCDCIQTEINKKIYIPNIYLYSKN